MISLFMPLILCVTVVASVGIGVVAAYAAVIGILQLAAAHRSNSPRKRDRAWFLCLRRTTPAGTRKHFAL